MSSIYLVAKESACTFIAHRLACSQLSCQVHLFIKAICGCERGCTGASLRFCEQMPQVASTRGASLSTRGMRAPTERALLELQRRFLICKVDVTGRTRGTYAYVWDLAERFWPERHLRTPAPFIQVQRVIASGDSSGYLVSSPALNWSRSCSSGDEDGLLQREVECFIS